MRWNRLRFVASLAILCAAAWPGLGARHSAKTAWVRQEPAQAAPEVRARPAFLVIIDASHGGDDQGATLSGKLLEKDLTLTLARLLRVELEERGVAVRMVRDSDVNVSLEHRAEVADELRPNLYIALHAGAPGQGARVYAPALALSPAPVTGPFVPWESAQAASIEQSKTAARVLTAEIRKSGMSASQMRTPLRPLNNVTAPAIAVEWAIGPQTLKPAQVQKVEVALASAIASGIVQTREQLGGRP
jgi:N-acetylmuramoyl-L-alanine amidase